MILTEPLLPPEVQEMKALARRFVRERLIPLENGSPSAMAGELPEATIAELQEVARAAGLWHLDVPADAGGAGLTLVAQMAVQEELLSAAVLPDRSTRIFGPVVGPVLLSCNEDQWQRYTQPVLDGERVGCFAQTEPDAGTDPGSMTTSAERSGDGWRLTGTKRFITGADRADFAQVVAYTDRSRGTSGGISIFLVDMDTPGVSIGSAYGTIWGERVFEIHFDNVAVPAENLVGVEGGGFVLAQQWLVRGRMLQAVSCLARARRAFEMAAEYAGIRETFGSPLIDRQAIQFMLTDSMIELHAARAMLLATAEAADRGVDVRYDAAALKIFGVETSCKILDCAIQIFGGIGLTTELPLSRWYMDIRSRRITEGSTEVMRMYLGRQFRRTSP